MVSPRDAHEPRPRATTSTERGLNFTLTTAAGDIDLIGDITGGGSYLDLLPHTKQVDIAGVRCIPVAHGRFRNLR